MGQRRLEQSGDDHDRPTRRGSYGSVYVYIKGFRWGTKRQLLFEHPRHLQPRPVERRNLQQLPGAQYSPSNPTAKDARDRRHQRDSRAVRGWERAGLRAVHRSFVERGAVAAGCHDRL